MAKVTDLLLLPFEDADAFDEDDPRHLQILEYADAFDEDYPQHNLQTLEDADAFDEDDPQHHLQFSDPAASTFSAGGFDSLVPDLSLTLRLPSRSTPSDSDSISDYPEDVSGLDLNLFHHIYQSPCFHVVDEMDSDDIGLTLGLPSNYQSPCFDVADEMEPDDLGLTLGLPSRSMLEIQDGECAIQGSGWGGNESSSDGPRISPFCWDLSTANDERREPNEEFEWEEVAEEEEDVYMGGLEELEALANEYASNALREEADEYASNALRALREELSRQHDAAAAAAAAVAAAAASNVGWEVLVSIDSLNRNQWGIELFIPDEGFAYTSGDQDSSLGGAPPAARLVVENLPSVVLTVEDVAKNNTTCAVCKDEILVNQSVKRLPCSHYYHEDCILPWLEIRNTCPLCRFELPTDDPEYEKWRTPMAANGVLPEEAQARYDSGMLPGV